MKSFFSTVLIFAGGYVIVGNILDYFFKEPNLRLLIFSVVIGIITLGLGWMMKLGSKKKTLKE